MSEPVNFDSHRRKRQPKCLFCGQPPHITELACPRIIGIELNDGDIVGIRFKDEYEYDVGGFDDDPPPAAA